MTSAPLRLHETDLLAAAFARIFALGVGQILPGKPSINVQALAHSEVVERDRVPAADWTLRSSSSPSLPGAGRGED